MGRLTLKVVRAVKASSLSEEEILAALGALKAPQPLPKPEPKRRTYRRRDMQPEA